jgi:endonuclease-8
MPEGDTIYKIAAALRPQLQGALLQRLEVRRPFVQTLTQCQVMGVYAHGKHLFIELEDGVLVRSHLGMYGSWHHYAPNAPWRRPSYQAYLVLASDNDLFVCFNAKSVELLRQGSIRQHDLAHRLGPDLLGMAVSVDEVVQRARTRLSPEVPLVDLLLDQQVACGIGNVYKSEVLFLEGHSPYAELGQLSDAMLARLYTRAQTLMGANLGGGPRVTRLQNDGAGGLWVYGRRNKPCLRCRCRIRYGRMGRHLRSTYWCPRCQSDPWHCAGQIRSDG